MFKWLKKKIYQVEFKDEWSDYGCVVVKAIDEADAWKRAKKQFWRDSVFRPTICLSINELKNIVGKK